MAALSIMTVQNSGGGLAELALTIIVMTLQLLVLALTLPLLAVTTQPPEALELL